MPGIKSFGLAVTFDGTAVGGLTDISIPEVETNQVDITAHDTTPAFRNYVGGLKDGGTVTLTGRYIVADAGQAKLADEADNGAAKAVVVTFSDSSTATFNAVLLGYGVSAGLDDAVQFTASLKVSGQIVYAAAA